MKFVGFLCAVAAALCVAHGGRAATLEAYGKLPAVEDMAISQDGKQLASLVTDGRSRQIIITSLTDYKRLYTIPAGQGKVRYLQWATPEVLLITYSVTGTIPGVIAPRSEHYLSVMYDVKTNRQRPLIGEGHFEALNKSIGVPMIRTIDGETFALVKGVEFVENLGHISLFRTSIATGKTKIVETGSEHTDDFLIDEAGVPVAQTEYDRKTQRWTIRAKRGRRWATLASGKHPFTSPTIIGFSDKPDAVVVAIDGEEDMEYREISLLDGSWGASLKADDVGGYLTDARERVIGARKLTGDVSIYSFNAPADKSAWRSIQRAFPKDRVDLAGWSDDRRNIIAYVDSVEDGPGYYHVNLDKKSADWLGAIRPGISSDDMAPVRTITYKAADGLEIPAYLTLPRAKTGPAPLIVLPHGGPASRDTPGFDWWAQALASRGYAVLQPNFRGSTGYGEAFLEAGYGEFGRKMQTDLSDGVRHLASEKIIDPKRVCIVGASYGGYAALAGVALDGQVYRCAASVAGISDLKRFIKTEWRDSGDGSFRYWNNFLGVTGAKDPDLKEISPVEFSHAISAPVLLVHGKDDTVVLYEQSRIMAEALKKANKPVEFVTLAGEDHWLSSGETRLQMLTAVVAFLEKHNPPN